MPFKSWPPTPPTPPPAAALVNFLSEAKLMFTSLVLHKRMNFEQCSMVHRGITLISVCSVR